MTVTGRDAVRYNFDGTYKSEGGYWVKDDPTYGRATYKNSRYIVPSVDGTQWEIIRATRTGSGSNYVDAIADKTGSCPTGLTWKIYKFRNYFRTSNNVSVTS